MPTLALSDNNLLHTVQIRLISLMMPTTTDKVTTTICPMVTREALVIMVIMKGKVSEISLQTPIRKDNYLIK